MAKYSRKMMGKEVGDGSFYAPPHTMTGKDTNAQTYSHYETGATEVTKMNMSVGNISRGDYPPVNPFGVGEMRGYGAATKGRKISGKMG